jgi:hypothetical protein
METKQPKKSASAERNENLIPMAKIKKFKSPSIRKITGGKDPQRLIEEFILRLGFDPETCEREQDGDNSRWLLDVGENRELEVLLEGTRRPNETTIYMGLNVASVPVRGASDLLAAALEIADGLIGIKVSLVGRALVLSASLGAAGLSVEELEYHYKLILAQQLWFRDALADELGWEELPYD